MEDEFDLRQYLAILRKRWRVAALTLLITLTAAALYTFVLQSAHYQARTQLIAQPQKYLWRLDVNFQTVTEDVRVDRRSDYAILVSEQGSGMELAQRVIAKMGDALPAKLRSPKAMWSSVSLKNGTGRLMTLDARAPTKGLATAMANTWADVLIAEVDARYGQGGDKTRFQQVLVSAQETLTATTKALQDLQARTGLGLELGSQMTTLQEGALAAGLTARQQEVVLKSSTLAEYQATLDRVRSLKARTEAVQTSGGNLNSLPLEVLDSPLLVQRGQLTRQQVGAMNGDLKLLLPALADEEHSLAATIHDLETEITALQGELAMQIGDRNLLNRKYSQAEEAVRALERKITEIDIQKSVVGPPLALLSSATQATPAWILTLGLAGVVGLLAGMLLALVLGYSDVRP
ncbi:MAG: Wzz/FepE/Etk N-terminal domain-containing protein [Chloroflexi bacterium]|nr:Wzz/FepE/Etk N-terminal domain-containing protein [Chloroflexota bacterium]